VSRRDGFAMLGLCYCCGLCQEILQEELKTLGFWQYHWANSSVFVESNPRGDKRTNKNWSELRHLANLLIGLHDLLNSRLSVNKQIDVNLLVAETRGPECCCQCNTMGMAVLTLPRGPLILHTQKRRDSVKFFQNFDLKNRFPNVPFVL